MSPHAPLPCRASWLQFPKTYRKSHIQALIETLGALKLGSVSSDTVIIGDKLNQNENESSTLVRLREFCLVGWLQISAAFKPDACRPVDLTPRAIAVKSLWPELHL